MALMAWLISGFMLGLMGSLHCVGMCGPLALSLPLSAKSKRSRLWGSFLYNAGRVIMYMLLGAVLGAIGYSFVLVGYQKWLSIGLGFLLLASFAAMKFLSGKFRLGLTESFFKWVRQKISSLFSYQQWWALFAIGLLNGLLPCGLVYLAIAMSLAGSTPLHSALLMGTFGLGTLPLMWMVSFFGSFILVKQRLMLKKVLPVLTLLMGCLLILRGLELGIPYISPSFSGQSHHEHNIICHE